MNKPLVLLALLAVLVASPGTVAATSTPVIVGQVSGIELCPQFVCGAASFAGSFVGMVDTESTTGSFWGAVTYDGSLPPTGESVDITGGDWLIWTQQGTYSGSVRKGGTITNNGDNTYTVSATLRLQHGGHGTLQFTGLLDHNVFPPTIEGSITQ